MLAFSSATAWLTLSASAFRPSGKSARPLSMKDCFSGSACWAHIRPIPGPLRSAFAGFLLIPGFIPKLIFVILVNLFNTGWYSILQGRLYSSLPGQSASIMAIGAVTTPIAKFFPLAIGFLADQFGLHVALWVLILGPIALLVGLPREKMTATPES